MSEQNKQPQVKGDIRAHLDAIKFQLDQIERWIEECEDSAIDWDDSKISIPKSVWDRIYLLLW